MQVKVKKKLGMLAVALTVVLAVVVVAINWPPKEPEYQGKPIGYWFEGFTNPPNTSDPNAKAILAMGESSVPFLRERLHSHYSRFHRPYAYVWPKFPTVLRQRLPIPHPAGWTQFRAAFLLAYLEPKAKAAIPDLVAVLDEQDSSFQSARFFAAEALGNIGNDAKVCIAELVRCLKKDPNAEVRAKAAQALGRIGHPAKAAVPALIEAVQSQHFFTRYFSIESIGKIAPDQVPTAIRTLVDTLRNGKADSTADRNLPSLFILLGEFGPSAHDAVPLLLDGLASKNDDVRHAAEQALTRIDPEAAAKAGVK